jgi:hypothetical protein
VREKSFVRRLLDLEAKKLGHERHSHVQREGNDERIEPRWNVRLLLK